METKKLRGRPKKQSKTLNCNINVEVFDSLENLCESTGLTKTMAVERALKLYIDTYKKTGRS